MAPVAPQNFPIGLTVTPDGAQAPVIEFMKTGNARISGQLTVGSISMIGGGTTGTVMDNNEFLSGLTSSSPAVVKRLIGVNSSNLVSIDPDAAGVIFGGDVTMQSETNPTHFVSDAGLHGGAGAFGFGSTPTAGIYFYEDAPALTEAIGELVVTRHSILASNALTLDGSGRSIAASLYVAEPNLTLSGGATVVDAATVYIAGAPSEAVTNYALFASSGAVGFVGDCSVGVQTNRTGNIYAGSDSATIVALDTAVTSAVGSSLTFRKARGTQAARTIVASADVLGQINFQGIEDSADYRTAAQIIAKVDGTPGSATDMPGRLEFWTTPDSSVTSTLALTISNAGALLLGAGLGRLNATTEAFGVGTPYALTNTAAAIDFGTTDPAIVIPAAGTYLISGQVNLAYNGATVVAETATIKVRRTNNTPADLSAVVVLDLPVATTLTHTYGIFPIPPFVYTTAATDDAVTLFANVSAALGAGTIDATAIGTSISVTRLY